MALILAWLSFFGVAKHPLGYLVFVSKLSGQQPALTQLRVMALQYSPSLPKDPPFLVTFLIVVKNTMAKSAYKRKYLIAHVVS